MKKSANKCIPPQPLDWCELHRKMDLVRRARFSAAHRYARHQRFSQWIVAMLSVALIFITVWPMMHNGSPLNRAVNIAQIVLAVLVLVYSLLLSMENSVVKSEHMYRCALEIDCLDRKLSIAKPTGIDLDKYSDQYGTILDRFENHLNVDYRQVLLEDERKRRRKDKFSDEDRKKKRFKESRWAYVRDSCSTYFRIAVGYAHYVTVSALVLGFITWLIIAEENTKQSTSPVENSSFVEPISK